jgi:ectoine hydroxylase-related dioxygenase (phytanoyl-CoA dioxygenase family)
MAAGGKTPDGYGGADAYAELDATGSRWPKEPYSGGTAQLLRCLTDTPLPEMIPPPVVCQVVWFVTDVTPENGGTCVVPGSHLTGILPPLSAEFTRLMPTHSLSGKAGTACVFDGRLWHATGANVTEGEERAMVFQYCATPNMRQQENLPVGLRPELWSSPGVLAEDLRARLGFAVWGPYNYTEKESRETRMIGYDQARPGEMKPPLSKM